MDIIEPVSDIQNSETEKKYAELQYKMALTSIRDPIHLIDCDYRIQFINSAFTEWLKELDLDSQVLNKQLFDVFPFLPEKTRNEYEHVFSSGKHIHSVEKIELNESLIVVETQKIPILQGEQIVQILTLVRNITQQWLAEKAVRKSEESLELVLKGADLGTWDYNMNLDLWRVSERFAEITEYSSEDYADGTITWSDLVHPDDFSLVKEHWNLHEVGDTDLFSVEYRLRTKSGKWKWVLDSGRIVHRDEQGIPTRSSGTLLDITNRKVAEQALRESEARYRLMADTIQDGLTIFEDFKVVYANDRACDIFGYTREELLTKATLDLVAPEELERIGQMVKDTMKTGKFPEQMDFWALRKNGERRYVSNRFSHTVNADGTQMRFIVTTDMTKQKIAEGELEKHTHALNERLKELTCLHNTTRLLASDIPVDGLFQSLVTIIQKALQYPDLTCVKVVYLHNEYETSNYRETSRKISGKITVSNEIIGELIVGYLGEINERNEDPFLKEEVELLVALSEKLGGYLEGKIAQQALSFSESKYRSLVETAASVIILLSGDGKIRELNQEAEKVYGYKLQEVIGRNYIDLFVPQEWHKRLNNQLGAIITGDYYQSFENPIITRDGSIRYFIWNASVIVDQGGQPSILGIGQDITKRKIAEDALTESEERYRYLFDNLADGIAIVDTNGIITMCNDRLFNIFGYTSDETIGKSFTEFLHPDHRETVFKAFLEGLDSETLVDGGFEVKAIRKDGDSFFINVSNTMIYEDGKPTGYQSVIRDITIEKESERTILEERDKAQGYLDIAGAAIVVLNNEGIVQLINQKGAEILGCLIDEVVGRNWFEHFVPSNFRSSIKQIYSDLLDGNNRVLESNEHPVLNSEGDERIIEWRNSVIRNSMGEPIGTMSSGVDVTERKIAEDHMKNAADTAMLYLDIMGHDIRNHLQAIVMGTDIMSHYELGAEIETIFELIVDSVENSQKLIDQVQATRELLSAPLKKINLWRILSASIENVQTEFPDVIFESQKDTRTTHVLADSYLRILCNNLLNNAVAHNTKKERKIWVSLSEVSDGYVVNIEDNGPGISDERKESLFDAGRRFGGIGIHQAKSIVEKYGGFLSIRDRLKGAPGQGASFSFWIPKTNGDKKGGLPK